MTYAHRSRQGFTLMELVVCLAVLAVVMSGTFLYFSNIDGEKRIREAAVALESMAREAQTRAIMTHTTHRIIITNNTFRLLDGDRFTSRFEEWQNLEARREYKTDSPEIEISLYRWGKPDKVMPSSRLPMVWTFPPEGFVEPITIRFQEKDSFIQQTYHPLTASVSDEEMEIK